jgi:hypothetical protein
MALPAILSELVLMGIFMAAGTICKHHTSELLKILTIDYLFFMALDAVNSFMFPDKLKPCICVVEF